jgi:hyaluronoglucosaminidase
MAAYSARNAGPLSTADRVQYTTAMLRAATALLVALSAVAGAAPAPLRGIIEGYYGRPWTGPARRDVVRFIGAHGMNAFVYAPKNDDFHRTRWREPYPAPALTDLADTATAARAAGVQFVYALSPVLDVCYSCPADFRALTRKLAQLAHAGVRRFALLFDDGGAVSAPRDAKRYGGRDASALARAQADLVNRTLRWLAAHHLPPLVMMVPTEYAGTTCLPYHDALARRLRRGVPVGWTGPGVFAETITAGMARARAGCLPRHPTVLWDNFPVNDTVVSNSLHLGPLTGRDPALPATLRGYLLNPMTQAHASLVAVATAAAYLRAPAAYVPDAAWSAALAELGGGGTGLGVLAAQVRSSALDLRDAVALGAAVDAVTASFAGAGWTPAVEALEQEEGVEAVAPADIAAHLGGTPLADEIAPWVDELGAHVRRGQEASRLLRALKPSLSGVEAIPGAGTLRVRGVAGGLDLATAAALGPGFVAEADAVAARIAAPPVAGYLACLGDFTGADIHFCPQFGLNVHGKALYFVIRTASDISLVSDRNVHERLVRLVGSLYTDWSARRGPGADTLTLTLAGMAVALAPDGGFDVVVPAPPARVTLLAATAAGEGTALDVP